MKQKMVFLATSICFLVFFFLFSIVVKKHYLTQFDFDMTVRLQDHTALKLDKFFPYFSLLASVQSMTVLVILFLLFRRKILSGIAILGIFLSAHIVELFGKVFINHPPPPFMFYKHLDATNFSFDKYYVSTGNSYPSGHSFRTMFLAVLLCYTFYRSKRLTTPLKTLLILVTLGLVLLICVSRISLGEHWTSDVIGGVFFGIAIGSFSVILL